MPPLSSRVRFPSREVHEVQHGEFFVGWGTLALINAGLAQGKGRGGFNWFLLSLLLGPLATFLVVVLDPLRPAQAGERT